MNQYQSALLLRVRESFTDEIHPLQVRYLLTTMPVTYADLHLTGLQYHAHHPLDPLLPIKMEMRLSGEHLLGTYVAQAFSPGDTTLFSCFMPLPAGATLEILATVYYTSRKTDYDGHPLPEDFPLRIAAFVSPAPTNLPMR